jgi:hypothetical protein
MSGRIFWVSRFFNESFFQLHVFGDCSAESVDACFVDDFAVSKIVPDRMDHCLVDAHEGTSWTPAAVFTLSPYKSTVIFWFALLICAPRCCLQMGEGRPNMAAVSS